MPQLAAEMLSAQAAKQQAESAGQPTSTDAVADDTGDAEASEAAKPWTVSDEERRLLHWHWANLEYGCSAPLGAVSLAHWNQVTGLSKTLEPCKLQRQRAQAAALALGQPGGPLHWKQMRILVASRDLRAQRHNAT